MKKKIAMLLSCIMLLGMAMQVDAAGTLDDCIISISCESNGVGITFETTATEVADEIGCMDIVLEEKINGSWRDINLQDCYRTNDWSYTGSAVYTGAVKGRTYRAHCTHYAVWGGTKVTRYNSVGEMVYN